ncbi:MAG: arginyltransferase [Kiloniellales bacterium]
MQSSNSPNRNPLSVAEQSTGARRAFYVLRESPCPYLAGRRERKLLTRIDGPDATAFYSLLSRGGFRRSHVFAYRPACSGCEACVPVRVVAEDFRPSRSHRRIAALNRDLVWTVRPAVATDEQYELFRDYIATRHGEGEMSAMDFQDYRSMVQETHLDSSLHEARAADGRLVAACLADWLEDGPSAVYSFFDPDLGRRSLGTWMVLGLIEQARRKGLAHVYLGYWIADSPKMAYKARFRPLEGFGPEGWRVIAD